VSRTVVLEHAKFQRNLSVAKQPWCAIFPLGKISERKAYRKKRLRKKEIKEKTLRKKEIRPKMKAILFDNDGVVVPTIEMFSQRFSREYRIPADEITPFFKGPFGDCMVGKADLKVVIKPYLKEWGWKKGVDALLQYWFKSEHLINTELVKEIHRLRRQGVNCCLATNQEKYRLEYMLKEMGFKDIFDEVFCSAQLGFKKPSMEFFDGVYAGLARGLTLKKEDVFYFDDEQKNVAAGNAFGFRSYLYRDIAHFKATIKL